jgi:hypothetical protein
MTFLLFVNQIKGFIVRRLTGNDFLPGFISWKCRKCERFGKIGSVSDLFGVTREALSGRAVKAADESGRESNIVRRCDDPIAISRRISWKPNSSFSITR